MSLDTKNGNLREKLPKVSSLSAENSRFWETSGGDFFDLYCEVGLQWESGLSAPTLTAISPQNQTSGVVMRLALSEAVPTGLRSKAVRFVKPLLGSTLKSVKDLRCRQMTPKRLVPKRTFS